MRIHYEISRRMVKNELDHYVDSKPSLTREQSIAEWIDLKFKAWIIQNITDDETKFDIEPVTNVPEGFKVTFVNDSDGTRFLSLLGGNKDD
ncbi:hypothetical protein G6M86_21020 [Agrobacterium tumefaciens]|uniref:Uncharacterized protein n=1 Tax=Agrobacterium tumefaciens TaxID=358 RepID=A0AAJ4N5T2_AGRTU|nr:hypothetical protein G6M86_21020 [Agrobacterium tumefaciens]